MSYWKPWPRCRAASPWPSNASGIDTSGTRLLSLLDALLDLTKLEAGKVELHLQACDRQSIAREGLVEFQALADSREIKLKLYPSTGDTHFIGDAARMLQVVRNLLSNAIKFSESGSSVLITFCRAPSAEGGEIQSMTCVEIRDEGVGIPSHELERVFDKFVQSSKTKTGAGGTGLGLAICQEIVTAHGGWIRARNNDGRGCTFTVAVPLASANTEHSPSIMPQSEDPNRKADAVAS